MEKTDKQSLAWPTHTNVISCFPNTNFRLLESCQRKIGLVKVVGRGNLDLLWRYILHDLGIVAGSEMGDKMRWRLLDASQD